MMTNKWMGAVLLGANLLAASCAAQAVTLQMGIGTSDIQTLDLDRATGYDSMLLNNLFNGLVRFPPGSADPAKLEPDLAEKWEESADHLSWTFHLRHGVQFHHGYGELHADDVVYSLNRASDPNTSSQSAAFEPFEKVEAVDPYTVRITLKRPTPGFLWLVANYRGGNITSRKAGEAPDSKLATQPIGTGPFEFAEHVPQQYVRLTAHEKYFRGKPKIDEIFWRFVASDSSRDLAFRSRQLDVIYGHREQRWVDSVKARSGVTLDVFGPGEFRALYLNRTIKPLDDIRIRQAIAYATDVDEIVQFVGKDVSQKGCSVVPPGYVGVDCSFNYHHDLEKAKQLLADAGYAKGLTLPVVVSNISSILPVMQVVQGQLAKAGITLDMKVVDHPTYHEDIRKDLSAIVFYGAARFPVADTYLTQFYDSSSIVGTPTAVTNFSHCSIGDEAIRAARVETDPAKQLAFWKTAQRQINDDVCGVPLFDLRQVWAHNNNVDYGYELEGDINISPPITELTTKK
ncbi:ABC transporter substrate-binding protein [Pseudomonas sp. RIT-PI-AD]|uniref:ABC transporter substrate-binding protein n=1 Tax=Pseudomonas sp. RIT-PI-AD TaxID=3035294 RepID=UPI0021DA9579|nr:ABC transporter substrate-binding protein [Pseudomonas sp. RIT-PI-AD]